MNTKESRAILSVELTPRWLYFGVALIAGFLSKAGALSFAFSPDDYFFAFPSKPDPYTFIGMGRGLSMLLTMGIQAIGLTYASIQFFTFWLSLAAFAWFVAISADLVAPRRVSKWLVAGCVAVIATHPYLSTYYVFRMSTLANAIAFASAAWALCILVHEDRTSIPRMLAGALLVAIFCNLTQSVLLLYMTTGLAWALAAACRRHEMEQQWQLRIFTPLAMVAVGSIVAGVLYFGLSSLVRHAIVVVASGAYTPHLPGGLAGVAQTQWKLVSYAFAGNEPVFPASIKIGCALLGVIALLRLDRRSVHWVIAALLLAVCGVIIATLPMTFSWQRYVPRTFFTLGPVLGLSYLLLIAAWRRPASRWFSAALFTLAGIFCLLSSTMFFQQRITTQWDQHVARSIVADASAQGLLDAGKLRVVARWPIHPRRLSIHEEGVNESAFLNEWSLKSLFLVSTGVDVDVTGGPESACVDKPRWPLPGYLFRGTAGEIYACVGGEPGYIMRGYPSAAEESAFKLNYPIFRRYGQASVRVTPFFPDTPRSVSILLAPSVVGYTLRMADATCAFPVDYTLTDSTGQRLAAGEEHGSRSIDLPGWNALTGNASLNIRMAAGAKNNYGCNIMVSTKLAGAPPATQQDGSAGTRPE